MNELERTKKALEVAMEHLIRIGLLFPGASNFGDCKDAIVKQAKHAVDAILNPPPEMEEVELNSWVIVAPSGFIETTSTNEGLQRDKISNPNSPFYGYQVAKLTGTYKRPVPQKVERSVSVEFTADCDGDLLSQCGKYWVNRYAFGPPLNFSEGQKATVTVTWEG